MWLLDKKNEILQKEINYQSIFLEEEKKFIPTTSIIEKGLWREFLSRIYISNLSFNIHTHFLVYNGISYRNDDFSTSWTINFHRTTPKYFTNTNNITIIKNFIFSCGRFSSDFYYFDYTRNRTYIQKRDMAQCGEDISSLYFNRKNLVDQAFLGLHKGSLPIPLACGISIFQPRDFDQKTIFGLRLNCDFIPHRIPIIDEKIGKLLSIFNSFFLPINNQKFPTLFRSSLFFRDIAMFSIQKVRTIVKELREGVKINKEITQYNLDILINLLHIWYFIVPRNYQHLFYEFIENAKQTISLYFLFRYSFDGKLENVLIIKIKIIIFNIQVEIINFNKIRLILTMYSEIHPPTVIKDIQRSYNTFSQLVQ